MRVSITRIARSGRPTGVARRLAGFPPPSSFHTPGTSRRASPSDVREVEMTSKAAIRECATSSEFPVTSAASFNHGVESDEHPSRPPADTILPGGPLAVTKTHLLQHKQPTRLSHTSSKPWRCSTGQPTRQIHRIRTPTKCRGRDPLQGG